MTDPLQLPLDVDTLEGEELLDAWFPRSSTKPGPLPEPVVEHGVYPGIMRKHHRVTKGSPTKNPHKLAKIGETLTKRILTKFGATLAKSPVHEIATPSGFFTQSTNVDYVGSILVQGEGRALMCDAKAWSGATFPLTRVSDKERGYFDRGMRARQLCVLSLVIWPQVCDNYGASGVDVVYLVTWQRWLEIERALKGRAKGNYKGKSLRRRDLDLLDGCKVERVSRRWTLEPGHWMAGMIKGGK